VQTVLWKERAVQDAVWISPDPEPLNASIYFFTRRGGVSSPPFDSLNVSISVGDDRESVLRNLERIRRSLGGRTSAWVKQVHGDRVARISEPGFAGEADALVSAVPGLPLVVGVADCLPLVLVGSHEVAIAHSGWRGTFAGIPIRAVEALASGGSGVSAYIGPCIRECCYEVSGELAAKFRDRFGEEVVFGDNLSLPAAVEKGLRAAGVENIYDVELCTGCRGDLFFSHRMQKPRTGRMLAAVTLR
jgi:YfiH family protein